MSVEPTEPPQNQTLNEEQLLQVVLSLRNGNLSVHLPTGLNGMAGEIATTFNELIDLLGVLAQEVTRMTREVGSEGWFGGQAEVEGLGEAGIWKEMIDNLNTMSASLTNQVRDMNNVTRVAINGDLTSRVTVGAEKETSELKNNINSLLDRLNSYSE